MPWFHAVVESMHELQNPTSAEKILLLGTRLGLGPASRVLDMGSGRAGPAIVLASTFGCRITCVERAEEFDTEARRRVREANLETSIELVRADASTFAVEDASYDVAMCLGASFIWGGLGSTLSALTRIARPSGGVVVGEPYRRTWPLPAGYEPDPGEDFLTLPATVRRIEAAGLTPVSMIDASLDDWDRYESLHWLAAEAWLADHADDPDAEEIRARTERQRERYLTWERDLLGWAIFVARTPDGRRPDPGR